MNKPHIQLMFAYNYWARNRVLETAVYLTPEQLSAPTLPHEQSILSTLTHTINAESLWRHRIANEGSVPQIKFEKPAETLAELVAAWQEEEQLMLALIDSLSDEAFNKVIAYKGLSGREFENVLWHILVQLVTHGTQHRSELALVLTEYGRSPGNLDFIIYIRDA